MVDGVYELYVLMINGTSAANVAEGGFLDSVAINVFKWGFQTETLFFFYFLVVFSEAKGWSFFK